MRFYFFSVLIFWFELQGLELRTSELEPILASLSKPHAEAIKQRVRTLNQTVRGRSKNRSKRKPDIRDVFRDFDVGYKGVGEDCEDYFYFFFNFYRNPAQAPDLAVPPQTLWTPHMAMKCGEIHPCKYGKLWNIQY